MSEILKNSDLKKEAFKEIIKRLHSGENVEKLKEEFKDLLRSISPVEVPLLEQELVKDGISPKEIAKLCDLHVELLRGNIERNVDLSGLVPGHPLHTLILENERIVRDAENLSLYAGALKNAKGDVRESIIDGLKDLLRSMTLIGRTHYSREEMLIFPYLERMGITAVPTVLWTKHDEIRVKISGTLSTLMKGDLERFTKHASELASMLIDMVYRENNIFYPTVRALLGDGEWKAVLIQESEYGYYKVEPKHLWKTEADPVFPYQFDRKLSPEDLISLPQAVRSTLDGGTNPDNYELEREGDIDLESGFLSVKEIISIFKNLPVDITFIDSKDRVRFFSGGERIFGRSKSVLGRPVQLCHPPKSVHIVNKILNAFKEGKRESAEFWIDLNKRKIYIKYIPIRDENGDYMGTLEITQDVTDIKKIEGEKRLLDWE